MEIDPNSDRPVFKQIADHFRDLIDRGELAPGAALPSEAQLSRTFGVAGGTARRALEVLRSEGLVVTEHGRGTRVRERGPMLRLASQRLTRANRAAGLGGFAADMRSLGLDYKQEMLHLGEVPAPRRIAERLNIEEGSPVFVRRRRMWGGGEPMQLADSYYPLDLIEGTPITEENAGPGGSYARLEERGHRLASFREELQARMPSEDEKKALRLLPGVPVVALVRTAIDTGGRAVEVFDSVMSADKHLFQYDFAAD
ncbi:GntR family transcriptional regulator [Kitasatospora sp. DSM 101779]|uniref:GntR family transcriptional regulator n=1 Tax=Kitasatospora sp. DSM 101779 TaxID=2853165 RepID=UPI0021D95A5F|nr:GntR family transcriptional regulator [Kitasatospora sp. DSM 101779]MCU7822850.1 GntR family transcriptional regulator [Kitasatospora sp. DSM 101779]